MTTPQLQSNGVKDAFSTGAATASTVTTLQSLLSAETKSAAATKSAGTQAEVKSRARNPTTTKATAPKASTKKAKDHSIDVHQDGNRSLTPKERYALATEIVNLTLKALTQTLKAKPKAQSGTILPQAIGGATPATPRRLSRTSSSVSQRVLQPRSGNSTPVTPTRPKSSPSKPSQNGVTTPTKPEPYVLATAECSRLAFSFLRSVNTKQLGLKELPSFQLENGMLILVGKLLAHGLDSLAIKELRIVKGRLEGVKAKSSGPPEKETLAGLLSVKVDFDKRPAALPLAITYQNLVLRVIASSSKPATIEACVDLLEPSEPASPGNLIVLQGERSGDNAKAGRLLEVLSSTILGMCPSLSSKADQIAEDRTVTPAPEAVLQLQSIGLGIRGQWWALVQHRPDIEKELLDPVSRCLSAFVRRTRKRRTAQQIYDTARHCVVDLISGHDSMDSKALFTIRRTLSSLAEGTGCTEEAQKWSVALDKQCKELDPNHAQRIAALARRVPTLDSEAASAALRELIAGLQDTISGSTSDYECLLTDLSRLFATFPEESVRNDDLQQLGALSVAFALRFVRSYPGRGLSTVQAIIHHALRQSKPSESGISWINHEAIQVLLDTGALKTIAQEARSNPMSSAWESSTAAVTVARALRLMVVRVIKSSSDSGLVSRFDDKRISNLERGLLLEYQLGVAIEHASRSKYHVVLQKLVPTMLQTLNDLYTSSEHPLRRAILATQVLRLHEVMPSIVPSQIAQAWNDTQLDTGDLLQDEQLRSYVEDIDVALRLFKILHAGHPSIRNLKPILLTWQRLLDDVSDENTFNRRFYDPVALKLSLRAIGAFFGALGEDAHRLSVLSLLDKVNVLHKGSALEFFESSVERARQWLSLGFSERSGSILAQSEKHLGSGDVPVLIKIQWYLAHAEYLLAIDNVDKSWASLEAAKTLRDLLPPKEVSKDQRATYERVHGEGWLLQSRYHLATGTPHEALAAAKHAMKVANSAWCRLETGKVEEPSKSDEEELVVAAPETKDSEVAELTTGVSKLRLLPKKAQEEEEENVIKGAAFWPLIPLLCKVLMHLSDMYSHHGLFSEANYYSGRASEIAESVGSSVLLSRTRSHRAMLLSLAGKVEEAELCLVSSEGSDLSSSLLAAVERLRAQGGVRVKDGAFEEAARLYDEAAALVSGMQTEDFMSELGRFEDTKRDRTLTIKPTLPGPVAVKTARSSARTRKATDKPVPSTKRPAARTAKAPVLEQSFYMLQKMRASILLDRTLLGLSSSIDEQQVLQALVPLKSTITGTLKQRHVQYHQLMAKATAALQMDFAYNILLDSTLSIPALLRPTVVEANTQSSPTKKVPPARTNTRAGQRKAVTKPGFKETLHEARGCLLTGHSSISQYCTSAEIYREEGNLLDVSMLCSSVDATSTGVSINSFQTGLNLDLPRINATQCEQSAALVDVAHDQKQMPFEWPSTAAGTQPPHLNAATFQEEYINTIPKPWTAVSLSLDESCTSLYVARYRADHTPFVVRLPFSRHQDEELGDEAFDYAAGKEELSDIIQLSNTSCHNTGDLSAKGAKSTWWNEREALDRRLQELLINMEDMWFGGFKGVLSPRKRQPELLARFRASFEAALDRHLPSRQAAKGRAAKLALDHNVLELFVNLGSDNEGTVDLDEPISDLLYFVVDTLQFNGERNAYDEIDFDEMTVEVLDALRSYHEASEAERDENQHVILVLDKRLQAFPWENLPCFEQQSVSRVGSMLSLRDCVTAMRAQHDDLGQHMVSRKSGAFILNPSSDLASTQITLMPALSKAAAVDGANWSSFVDRAPSEDDFKTTLENYALTLYFGHGAGSQYIRPRTIKKLEKCSEVVWLMGCSSGAVTEHGELEPQAVPLAYLNAGRRNTSSSSTGDGSSGDSKCLAVVATLWDVTDKDIDRFSLTVGEEWGLWSPPAEPTKLPSKTPKKRERLAAPSTPQRAPKTPKTPRVLKTPAAAKTPARSRSRSTVRDRSVQVSLAGAVAKSRDTCYLRYLNGAAPVVYGVPVYLGE